MAEQQYHHGNLRHALLQEAFAVVADRGVEALSLRDLARRTGVSHAAPAHHFGDRNGLLVAMNDIAVQSLRKEMLEAFARTSDMLEVGAAYVRWAIGNPGYAEVLTRGGLKDFSFEGPASSALAQVLQERMPHLTQTEVMLAMTKAWAVVHGLVTLIRGHAIPPGLPSDPEELARAVLKFDIPAGVMHVPMGIEDQ